MGREIDRRTFNKWAALASVGFVGFGAGALTRLITHQREVEDIIVKSRCPENFFDPEHIRRVEEATYPIVAQVGTDYFLGTSWIISKTDTGVSVVTCEHLLIEGKYRAQQISLIAPVTLLSESFESLGRDTAIVTFPYAQTVNIPNLPQPLDIKYDYTPEIGEQLLIVGYSDVSENSTITDIKPIPRVLVVDSTQKEYFSGYADVSGGMSGSAAVTFDGNQPCVVALAYSTRDFFGKRVTCQPLTSGTQTQRASIR